MIPWKLLGEFLFDTFNDMKILIYKITKTCDKRHIHNNEVASTKTKAMGIEFLMMADEDVQKETVIPKCNS